MAILVLAMLGLVHLGLYLVLTASARRELDGIEARYEETELAAAREPSARAPTGDPAALARWNEDEARWEAREAAGRHRHHVRAVGVGLLFAYLVQLGVVGVLLARSARAYASAPSDRGTPSGRTTT